MQSLLRSDVQLNKTVGEYWIPHSWSILRYNKLATRMGLNLNPLTPFLQNLGEPSMPFTAWTRVYENYVLAIQENALTDARKCTLLIHCFGT